MSKVICLAPWVHSYAASQSKSLCCISKTFKPFKPHEEFWNGSYMTGVRRDFMNGVQRPECAECFGPQASQDEDRRYYQHFKTHFGHLEEEALAMTNTETGETQFDPVSFDMRQRLCNMTCKTCGTGSSSAHALASNRSTGKTVFITENFKDTMEAHTDDLLKLVSERTTEIYWAGGEPLMSPVYWATMERMAQNGWTQAVMRYNLNGTRLVEGSPVAEKAMEYFRLFKSRVFLSLDGIGVVNDYVRSGSTWSDMDAVLRRLVREVKSGQVAVDMTCTNLGLLQLPEVVRYLDDVGVQHFHIKGMVEYKGILKGGEVHNCNSYLSISLLKQETAQRVLAEVEAMPETSRFKGEALKFLNYILPRAVGRQMNGFEEKAARDAERRFSDSFSIFPVLERQAL
jgi:sulfatase maturation enzyme AslB (radical SAM superfamily)